MISKGYNPKGLALFSSGLIFLKRLKEAENLLRLLLGMQCNGYKGTVWGYNFPWQARAFFVPVGKPNIVATVFAANAFLDFYEATGKNEYLEIAGQCCGFILSSNLLFEDKKRLCFAYISGEQARVHNANMLAAALLARIYKYNGNEELAVKSGKAIAYSMDALTDESFWPYGNLPHHQFIDSFHTGFNLIALEGWINSTGDTIWEKDLVRAYNAYLNTFWLEDGCPKYYHDRLYPIDIHCSTQGIITCMRLVRYDQRSIPFAKKIAQWAINNMQDKNGFFYYQKARCYINRIPYIRWAQAWMFYALALYISQTGEEKSE